MPSFSGFFTRNLTLKVSAFIVALLLWFSVQWEAPGRFQFQDVPVRVDLSDPDWVLVGNPSPATVSVSLQGAAGDLTRTARPTIVVPMDAVTTGDTTVVLRSQWVRVQDRPGVGVEDIQPQTVSFTFERVERMTLPLAFALSGTLPEGLALGGPPLPATQEVRVTGPQSRILEMDSVRFEPLDLSEITQTGTRTLGVDTTLVQGLQIQPSTVEVEVRIEEWMERTVDGIEVVLSDSEFLERFEGVPSEWTVTLSGARTLVERLDPARLQVVVEIDEDRIPEPGEEGIFELRVRGLPDWVEAELEEPEIALRRISDA